MTTDEYSSAVIPLLMGFFQSMFLLLVVLRAEMSSPGIMAVPEMDTSLRKFSPNSLPGPVHSGSYIQRPESPVK